MQITRASVQHAFSGQEPVTIKLGKRMEYVNTGSKRRLCEVEDTFQYVPLLEGLKSLLAHAEIRDEACMACETCRT